MKRPSSSRVSALPAPVRRVLSGRQRLMLAALELAATTRSWAALGLREVARQAGLNPNTFYRHFKDFDDLGLALIGELSEQLRVGLRERRRAPAARGVRLSDTRHPAMLLQQAQGIVRESVQLALDFVGEHPKAYVVGIRELHGGSPRMRQALRQVIDDIAADMAEDIRLLQLPLDDTTLQELSRMVIRQMSLLALDYVEHLDDPAQLAAIRQQSERFILLLFWGALAQARPQP